MILHVTDAQYLGDFRVQVSFNDGREGVAALKDALRGPVFEPLKEGSFFAQLSIDTELETISWPNGVDLAPEYIYYQAFRDESQLQEKFKEWGYIA